MGRFLRTAYNYDVDQASADAATHPEGESMTVQSEKDACDINLIVKEFGVSQLLPVTLRVPMIGDFSEITDYHSALETLREADEAFMEMPVEVRARFNNDPGEFVDFCSDPANVEEMRKLGLLNAKELEAAPAPIPAPAAAPAPAAGPAPAAAPAPAPAS